jgi:hypothetical protein
MRSRGSKLLFQLKPNDDAYNRKPILQNAQGILVDLQFTAEDSQTMQNGIMGIPKRQLYNS